MPNKKPVIDLAVFKSWMFRPKNRDLLIQREYELIFVRYLKYCKDNKLDLPSWQALKQRLTWNIVAWDKEIREQKLKEEQS